MIYVLCRTRASWFPQLMNCYNTLVWRAGAKQTLPELLRIWSSAEWIGSGQAHQVLGRSQAKWSRLSMGCGLLEGRQGDRHGSRQAKWVCP
eukprot:4925395-Amphidinium_carterae.1